MEIPCFFIDQNIRTISIMRKIALPLLLFLLFQITPFIAAQETPETQLIDPPRIVFITADYRIATIDTTGEDLQLLTESGQISGPQWSIDGKQILYMDYGASPTQYIVINRDGSDPTVVAECSRYSCSDAIWSPDGTRIAYTSSDGMTEVSFHVVDLASGETQVIGTIQNAFYIQRPSWSPDGQRLVALHNFTLRQNNISAGVSAPALANLSTGQVQSLTQAANEMGWHDPVWLPDSRHFILSLGRYGLNIYDIQSHQYAGNRHNGPELSGRVTQYLDDILVVNDGLSRSPRLILEETGSGVTEETILDPFPVMWLMAEEDEEIFAIIEDLESLSQYVNIDEDGIVFRFSTRPDFIQGIIPIRTVINRYDAELDLIDTLTIKGFSPHWGPIPLDPANCTVTAISNVNKRAEATTNSPIMGTLSARQEVGVLSATQAEDGFIWWQLDDEDQGWVRGDLVNTHRACNLVPKQ
jgi:hypothetical protein